MCVWVYLQLPNSLLCNIVIITLTLASEKGVCCSNVFKVPKEGLKRIAIHLTEGVVSSVTGWHHDAMRVHHDATEVHALPPDLQLIYNRADTSVRVHSLSIQTQVEYRVTH